MDILPIRRLPNVITLVGDITTEKCKAAVRATLQGAGADVVSKPEGGKSRIGARCDSPDQAHF